jgi:hypothetical protein
MRRSTLRERVTAASAGTPVGGSAPFVSFADRGTEVARTPRLSTDRRDGDALVNCLAACQTQEVVAAPRLGMDNLFEPEEPTPPLADGRPGWSHAGHGRDAGLLRAQAALRERHERLLACQRVGLEELRGWTSTRQAVTAVCQRWSRRHEDDP